MTECLVCDTKYNPLEVYIVCGGCNALAHPKCISLNGRIADKIKEVSGLYWYCSACRKISPRALLEHVKGLQSSFEKLQREFTKVNSLLTNFETSFSDNHPIYLSSDSTTCGTAGCISSSSVQLHEGASGIPSLVDDVVAEVHNVALGVDSGSKSKVSLSAEVSNNIDILSDAQALPELNSVGPEQLPHCDVNTSNSGEPLSAKLSLKVAQKPKTFFISRLDPSTSSRDVEEYVRAKCKVDSSVPVYCELINSRRSHRLVSSFKISTTSSVFNLISSPEFWPENIIAHEFLPRKKAPRKPRPSRLNRLSTEPIKKN